MSTRFDAAYYQRFYHDPQTQVHGAPQLAALGAALHGFCGWFGLPLRRVLEVGAGIGLLRDWFRVSHPELEYVSTEYSEYAAAQFGHAQLDITRERPRGRFELVVCQGVLQYLPDEGLPRAIEHLAAACTGLMYLEVVTERDLRTVCDLELTDVDIHVRSGRVYRELLEPHFEPVGAGLWHRRGGSLSFYELEAPARRAR